MSLNIIRIKVSKIFLFLKMTCFFLFYFGWYHSVYQLSLTLFNIMPIMMLPYQAHTSFATPCVSGAMLQPCWCENPPPSRSCSLCSSVRLSLSRCRLTPTAEQVLRLSYPLSLLPTESLRPL